VLFAASLVVYQVGVLCHTMCLHNEQLKKKRNKIVNKKKMQKTNIQLLSFAIERVGSDITDSSVPKRWGNLVWMYELLIFSE
jgi:hypothetical protein